MLLNNDVYTTVYTAAHNILCKVHGTFRKLYLYLSVAVQIVPEYLRYFNSIILARKRKMTLRITFE